MKALSVLLLAAAAPVAAADPAPPVSLAWNLRPAAPGNVARVDSVLGTFTDKDVRGETFVSVATLAYKVLPTLVPVVRVAALASDPATGPNAGGVSNPVIGATWSPLVGHPWKLGVFGALAVPVGSGGGNTGDPARAAAEKAAVVARSSMDNAMFAVNDLTPIVGLDLAYVDRGLTLQAEATVLELIRVRGEAVDPDHYKTNFTSGFHAGYFVLPWLCASAEVRYQRYLSTPAAVAMAPATRDNLTVAIGVRGQWKLDDRHVLRPGLSYARGLDDPMASRGYDIIQLDLPFAF